MSTHAFDSRSERRTVVARFAISPHWLWLVGGLGLAFVVPYLLTDILAVNRDVFYGLYALRGRARPATTCPLPSSGAGSPQSCSDSPSPSS